MTTQDKPAVGPLSAGDVPLLVKGDLLRVIEAGSFLLGRGLVDGGVATVRSVDGPYVDVYGPAERSDNRASRFAFIGRPGPDGWMPWSGGENPVPGQMVELRLRSGLTSGVMASEEIAWDRSSVIAFRLAPTAPVETLGETKGPGGYLVKDFADGWYWTPCAALEEISGAPVWSVEHSRYETSPTQPDTGKGEAGGVEREREAVARLIDPIAFQIDEPRYRDSEVKAEARVKAKLLAEEIIAAIRPREAVEVLAMLDDYADRHIGATRGEDMSLEEMLISKAREQLAAKGGA